MAKGRSRKPHTPESDNPALKDVLPKDYARPALDKQQLVAELHTHQAAARKPDAVIADNLKSLGFGRER